MDIRVSHENYDQLAKLLKAQTINFIVQIPDADVANARQNPVGSARAGGFDYNQYNTLDKVWKTKGAFNTEIRSLVLLEKT